LLPVGRVIFTKKMRCSWPATPISAAPGAGLDAGFNLEPRFNIAPTQMVADVRIAENDSRELQGLFEFGAVRPAMLVPRAMLIGALMGLYSSYSLANGP
jgi:hypothetical protein